MSFSSGTFSINSAGQPVVTGTVISSTAFNALTADLATGLSTCVLKDGTQTLTANIPMASFKLTGLGVGSALTDSVNMSQIQSNTGSYLTSVAGTNTVTGTATPTPAYAIGQRFTLIPAVTSTGPVTLNISSVGAGAVQLDGAALTGGEFEAGTPVTVLVTAATPVFEIIPGLSRSTQAQQEAGTSATTAITPATQQFHPSASKGWVKAQFDGAILVSYNVSSITDGGAGTVTVNWATDFSTANYAVNATAQTDPAGTAATTYIAQIYTTTLAAGAVKIVTLKMSDFSGTDADALHVIAFGDQ